MSRVLKLQDLLAKLKKDTNPWDNKLYPVIKEEYVCAGVQGLQAASQCQEPLQVLLRTTHASHTT
jgi:hypothetical protein